MKMISLKEFLKSFWSHHHTFPYYHNFIIHHLLNDIQVETLIFGQKMKMNKNNFAFIYFPIMDEFHPNHK
jgi:hypothetical protein